MSALTKIFIVLLVVISIVFTSVTISAVVQTPNWRETAEKYREHALTADTNLRYQIAAGAARLATARDEVQARMERINRLQTDLQECSDEATRARAEVARAASEKSSAEAVNRGLLAHLQVSEAGRAEYRGQREELERRNIDLERRNADLSDRVNELTATTTVLLEQKRQYEQQINILRAESEKLARQTGRLSAGSMLEEPEGVVLHHVEAVTPVAATAIRGTVLEVSGNLVTLSVGSADGVKKDMVFVVHRDAEYVGDVRINLVDPNQSAGRLIRSTVTPTPGDNVANEASLTASRG